jgi:hypothetical protein
VDPRAGLDDVKKRKFLTLLGLELRSLGRSARSQSLYRLRYPGPLASGLFLRKREDKHDNKQRGSGTSYIVRGRNGDVR